MSMGDKIKSVSAFAKDISDKVKDAANQIGEGVNQINKLVESGKNIVNDTICNSLIADNFVCAACNFVLCSFYSKYGYR